MTVTGSIDVVSYLFDNCTNSPNMALQPFLNYRVWLKQGDGYASRPPPPGLTTFAYGFTGPCIAPGNLYRDNETLLDNRFNLAFWADLNTVGEGLNDTDLYPGWQWGAAPNAWFIRDYNEPGYMQSIVLYVQEGGTFCCNLDYDGYPASDDVLNIGQNCSTVPDDRRKQKKKMSLKRKSHKRSLLRD